MAVVEHLGMAGLDVGWQPPDAPQLCAIAARHGFSDAELRSMPTTGEVNWIYALGQAAVLRVANGAHPDAVRDALTESVAVPAVRAAGVRTPRLLVFDNSRDIVDALFTIYERVPGQDLASRIAAGLPVSDRVYRQLGRELAKLHSEVTDVPDPNGWLDTDPRWVTSEAIDDLLRQPLLDAGSAGVLAALYEQLEPALQKAATCRRFLHQDLSFGNIMSYDGEFAALIDWGDAGWADPAQEFAYLPLRVIDHMLTGYREIIPLDDDDTAETRILWDHLGRAAYDVLNRPGPMTGPDGALPPRNSSISASCSPHAGRHGSAAATANAQPAARHRSAAAPSR